MDAIERIEVAVRSTIVSEMCQRHGPHWFTAAGLANRTKKTIIEKMEEDPFFYRKFSLLLKQAIDDYHAQRISDAEYLAKVTEIMEQVRDGKMKEAPDLLKERDLSRAFFGALQKELSEEGRSCSP